MKRYFRDTITIEATGIESTAEGFIIIPARLTRAGLFEYSYGMVMRSEYEVSRSESIRSLVGKSLTDLHPEGDIFVMPENWKDYEVGTVTNAFYDYESAIVSGRLIVKEQKVIDRILEAKSKGESIELSCGYYANVKQYAEDRIDPKSGEKYRYEQFDIIYNHVALVPKGRAGSDIKLMLDSMDKQLNGENMKFKINQKKGAEKVFLDSVEIVVDEANSATLEKMEKALDSACAEVDILDAKLKAEQTKCNDCVKELEEMKKTHVDAKEIDGIVDRKINLMNLCDGLNIDHKGKTIDAMENEIVKVAMPSINLDGKTADYRKAIVDSSLELAKKLAENNKKQKDGFVLDPKKVEDEKGFFENLENKQKGGK